MTEHVLQAWMLMTSVAGIHIIRRPEPNPLAKWGFTIGAIGQPAWLWVSWHADQWGIFVLAIYYQWAWADGALMRWWPRYSRAMCAMDGAVSRCARAATFSIRRAAGAWGRERSRHE